MARLLYVWELGAGLGHLSPMAPIVRRLVDEGHEVHAAIRSLEKAHLVFADLPVTYWQAPLQPAGGDPPFPLPATLPHILANTCFRDADELATRMMAWGSVLRAVRPDLVVLDHAPSALLALERFPIPKALIGTGFTVPPTSCRPFPNWRPELDLSQDRLERDERWLLDRLNRWREAQGLAPHDSVGRLYAGAEHRFLTTFPELDHFGPRVEVYQGIWFGLKGAPFDWPPGNGGTAKKVFVYLKPHDQLPGLLRHLRDTGAHAVLYVPGVKPEVVREFGGPRMHFATSPVDLAEAARRCDLAVLNSTHGSVSAFLLAGKPMLLLPIFLEQRITAERAVAIGAAAALPAEQMQHCGAALHHLLSSGQPRHAAERFRDRYRAFQFMRRADQVAERVIGLMT